MDFGSSYYFVEKQSETETVIDESDGTFQAPRPLKGPSKENESIELRCVVMGMGGVGKSAIVIQFVQNHFICEYDPTIEDSYRKAMTVDGRSFILDILDTAGQEEYSSLRDLYMKRGDVFLCVYAENMRASFDEVSLMRAHIQRMKDADDVIITLCGNKSDLVDDIVVKAEEGRALAQRWNCPFVETSAKTGANITLMFEGLCRSYVLQNEKKQRDKSPPKRSFFTKMFGPSTTSNDTKGSKSMAVEPSNVKTHVVPKLTPNMLVIDMGSLSNAEHVLMTGEPLCCPLCSAVAVKGTVVNENGNWKCLCCAALNEDGVQEQVPKDNIVDYVIGGVQSVSAEDTSALILCLDISGSMSLSVPIPAVQLEWARLKGGITTEFVSRMQCAKAAADSHIDRILKASPNRRVLFITFSQNIVVYDGSSTKTFSEKLSDYNALLQYGADLNMKHTRTLAKTRDALSAAIVSVQENGSTALGPTLALALGALKDEKTKSEIIVITDGLSNCGVGELEELTEESKAFYKQLGREAVAHNVVINIIGLRGENSSGGCQVALDVLSQCSAATHGNATIVNPLELLREVRTVSQNPIVATEAKLCFTLPTAIDIVSCETELDVINEKPPVQKQEEIIEDTMENWLNRLAESLESAKRRSVRKEDFESASTYKSDLAIVETMKSAKPTELTALYDQLKADKLKKKIGPPNVKDWKTQKNDTVFAPLAKASKDFFVGNVLKVMDRAFFLRNAHTPAAFNAKCFAQESAYFQMRCICTRLDGLQILRVMTVQLPITKSRSAAEESANISAIGVCCSKYTSALGAQNKLKEAIEYIESTIAFTTRTASTPQQREERYAFESQITPYFIELKKGTKQKEVVRSDSFQQVLSSNRHVNMYQMSSAPAAQQKKAKSRFVPSAKQEIVSSFGKESHY